jgi:hypothetical protein
MATGGVGEMKEKPENMTMIFFFFHPVRGEY